MLKRRLAFGSRVGTYRLLRNCGPSDEEKEIGRRAPLTADISQISETGRRFSASNPCRWGEGGKSLPPGALRPFLTFPGNDPARILSGFGIRSLRSCRQHPVLP